MTKKTETTKTVSYDDKKDPFYIHSGGITQTTGGKGDGGEYAVLGENRQNTVLQQGQGNDLLMVYPRGTSGNKCDGGAGTDKVVFSGKRSDYKFTFNSDDNSFTAVYKNTGALVGTFTNYEQVAFAESSVAVDIKTLRAQQAADEATQGNKRLPVKSAKPKVQHLGPPMIQPNGRGFRDQMVP